MIHHQTMYVSQCTIYSLTIRLHYYSTSISPSFQWHNCSLYFLLLSFNLTCCCMSPCFTQIFSHYFVLPSGSCMKMERREFSQLHFSKELCVNSKPKPRRASKQDGLPENDPIKSKLCCLCQLP